MEPEDSLETFREFFFAATGHDPYDYQWRLARHGGDDVPGSLLINIPTGLGKTAATVAAWLWKLALGRFQAKKNTCLRRLVYCLPMRTLVEQTRDNVAEWLARLAFAANADDPEVKAAVEALEKGARGRLDDDRERLLLMSDVLAPARDDLLWLVGHSPVVLMGGEEIDREKAEWDIHPERPAILIGTQDMLLSRALNRGYGMSRYRWPMHFGLLNNDCLWVMDEVQLMGPGLGTACQLEAFREDITGSARQGDAVNRNASATWYVSATASRELVVSRDWRTADGDRRPPADEFVLTLGADDLNGRDGAVGRRRLATKTLEVHEDWHFEDGATPGRIVSEHMKMLAAVAQQQDVPRRTLIVCNTVRKARSLFGALRRELGHDHKAPELLLLHSRFRGEDRRAAFKRVEKLLSNLRGQIVVATQVVEAGVDISSAVLWTEAATLPCIVQRLGRLNRAGEFGHDGSLDTAWVPIAFVVGVGIDPPPTEKKEKAKEREKRERSAFWPYEPAECNVSIQMFSGIRDASPASLGSALGKPLADALKSPIGALQRHELLDFFDTDANLSLGYTDVTPFVRGLDSDTDLHVLWRRWSGVAPRFSGSVHARELCPVPARDLKKLETWRQGFVWQGHEQGWRPSSERNLFPGAILLLPVSAGGYSSESGWTGDPGDNEMSDLCRPPQLPSDPDLLSVLDGRWASIGRHTLEAKAVLKSVLEETVGIRGTVGAALLEAMEWHDFGKNHPEWQRAVLLACEQAGIFPETGDQPFAKFSLAASPALVGKSGEDLRAEVYRLKRTFRPGLRHEVASALALRQRHRNAGRAPGIGELLAEYLVMSHHGRVRKVLRDELPKSPKLGEPVRDEVCGISDGTQIGAVSIGCDFLTAGPLSIECRKLGRCRDGSEAWTKGVLRLLDAFGPLRVAYFEALFRAADWRASSGAKD